MDNKINFTKANLTAIQPPHISGKRVTYHDTKMPGLQLRVTSKGTKTFSVFRRIKGSKAVCVTLGRYPHFTIEQARRGAAEINAALENGTDPTRLKHVLKDEPTFGELFSQYIERYGKSHKRTWGRDVGHFNQYLAKSLGDRKLSTIKRADLALIHSEITQSGKIVPANRILALISSVYSWAISAGLCENNPAIGIKRNPEKARSRFLQEDELPHFFDAVAAESNESIRDYIVISLLTGARQSNVLSMRWEDLDLNLGKWQITRTKNNEPQTIPLLPEAITILKNRQPPQPEGFVFPGTGKHGHLVEPKKGWQRILNRAGITDLRIHDLRRTLGSWQAKTGASLTIIGKSLNHKSVQSTAIYARLDLDPVRQSMEKATSAMLAAAGFNKSQEESK